MSGYVMDTSAWIEFFRGSSEGKRVAEYLFPGPNENAPLITSTLVITEMQSIYVRNEKEDKLTEDLERIHILSKIEERINERSARIAGTKHAENHERDIRISYVDCILWTLAEERNMKILSTDSHFKDCSHAIYIEKGENDEIRG